MFLIPPVPIIKKFMKYFDKYIPIMLFMDKKRPSIDCPYCEKHILLDWHKFKEEGGEIRVRRVMRNFKSSEIQLVEIITRKGDRSIITPFDIDCPIGSAVECHLKSAREKGFL